MAIRLVSWDSDSIEGILDDPNSFASRHGLRLDGCVDLVTDVARQTSAHWKKSRCRLPWVSYFAAEAVSRQVVGVCAFKHEPDDQGAVEIAYFTMPPHEGRGHATDMAAALVAIAENSGTARVVVANTLPEVNASTRVLERNGFRRAGEGIDDEVGRTWRWERVIG